MAVTNYYTVNGALIGEKTAGGSRTDYLTDALGNVTATLNQSGQVVNTYRYKPYGAQLAKTGVGADPAFRWVGSQGYRQTGKKYSDVYVRARHYDSLSARWTTKDPLNEILVRMATALSKSPRTRFPNAAPSYVYVSSRPSLRTDSSGLLCCLNRKGPGNQGTGVLIGTIFPPGTECCSNPDWDGCTDCNPSLLNPAPWSLICGDDCLFECLDKHEAVHRADIASCCQNYGKAFQQTEMTRAC